VSRSILVARLYVGGASLRKEGRDRLRGRKRAQFELEDVNFAWWALASAFSFIPCAILALASDAAMEQLAGWSSPSPLGMFLMLAPWALVVWFLLRALATAGSAKVTAVDDLGVLVALLAASVFAVIGI
jgi:hypothetical protein